MGIHNPADEIYECQQSAPFQNFDAYPPVSFMQINEIMILACLAYENTDEGYLNDPATT